MSKGGFAGFGIRTLCWLITLSYLAIFSATQASAISPEQRSLLKQNILYYDLCGEVNSSTQENEGPGNLPGLTGIVDENGGFSAAVLTKSGNLIDSVRGNQRPAASASTLKPIVVHAALELNADINPNDITAALDIRSDNNAANNIIRGSGIQSINSKISQLGYKNTTLNNTFNPPAPVNGGNVTSAEDIAKGISGIINGQGAKYETARSALESSAKAKGGRDYWGNDVAMSKWGGTSDVSAVSVLTNSFNGKQYIISVYVNEPNANTKITSIINEIQQEITEAAGTGNDTADNNQVYMLGDSITLRASEALKQESSRKNLDLTINSSESRSITKAGTTSGYMTSGLEAVAGDEAKIKDTSKIIIALGTNQRDGNFKQAMGDMLSKVNQVNDDAKIYWVNVFSGIQGKDDVNNTIEQVASDDDVSVIDVASKDIELDDGDTVHQSPKGSRQFAEEIFNELGESQPPQSSGNPCACQSGNGPGTLLSGDNDAEKIWNFLVKEFELSNVQAAGIMANIQAESGFNPLAAYPSTTSETPPGTGTAWGIAQWLGGRQTNLVNFARDKGANPNRLDIQLEFLKSELLGSYKNSVLNPIKASNNLAEVTRIWLERFEIPCTPGPACDPEMNKRLPYAEEWEDGQGEGGGGGGSDASATSDCGSSGATTGEYVWPIEGAVASCWKNDRGGHLHSGLDISNVVGTDIVATDGGTVEIADKATLNPDGYGYVIVIKHDDNKWSLYGHLSEILVSEGDKVGQGDLIAKSGGAVGATGSGSSQGPHLHFNIQDNPGLQGDASNTLNPLDFLPKDGRSLSTGSGTCAPGPTGYQ